MNSARLRSIIDGLTGSAAKVYEATPISDPWTPQQIYVELRRLNYGMEFSKLQGCLRDLCSQGLVRKYSEDRFARVALKDQRVEPNNIQQEITVMPTVSNDPIKQLEAIAKQLREDAAQLVKRADAIDACIIEVLDTVQTASAANEQLRQLRALLKG